ncbi:MAG: GerW family sporulation protein [Eubacteriales bacterium]|nr:GerW family sporulation protein [Eubacteriales bacterium]
MENENNFKETVNSLFKGMDSFVSAKTVVGDAIHVGETIILPLVDVSFGVGAGAFAGEKKNNGGGGMAGKMTPCAVLVIQNGTTKLVNIKNQDGLTKVLDMVPDFVNKFSAKMGDSSDVEDIFENDADTQGATEEKTDKKKDAQDKEKE